MKVKVVLALLLLSAAFINADDAVNDESKEEVKKEDSTEDEAAKPKEENGVLVLTKDNFEKAIKDNTVILVEFYAPWCGHCKDLAPKYEAAAKILKENTPSIALGKVDATVEPDLSAKYDVGGYPTIKLFKNGEVIEYDGPRDTDGIVEYMKEKADPNWKPPPEAVVTLTKDNFDEVVNKEELILVEFYAPWCGHCKDLAPKYEKAAKELQNHTPPILLAKVDATVESELASKHGVSGYPTLKLFRKGRAFEYKGPRDEHGIAQYMQDNYGDASKEKKTLKDIKNFMNEDDVTIIGFFESDKDKLYETYQDSANDVREDFTFAHTFDADARKHYKANAGSVVVFMPERFYTKYESKWNVFDKADATIPDLQKFYKAHQTPLVGHMTYSNQDKRYKNRPLCLVHYTVDWTFDHKKATQLWRNKVADIAKDYKDITFAIVDEDDFADQFKAFGFDESGEEINIGCLDKDEKKYPMPPMDEFDSDEIREFINSFKNGKIMPKIKSQAVPKKQSGPVTVVVGKNFEDIVMDSKKDVLIEFYAPWCGHCKSMEPTYKKLAKKHQSDKKLVIAKIDSTANDSPSQFKVDGFPTIYFAPANNKDKPIKHDGGRGLDDLEKFIEKHATVSLGKGAKDEL